MSNDPQDHGHEVTIIVNGRPKVVEKAEMSYDEIVRLAYPNPHTEPEWVYTVTFSKGPDDKKEGTLTQGQTVKVKKDMIFNVTEANKS